MPNWDEIGREIAAGQREARQVYDQVRRSYLKKLHEHTKRNCILYCSGWLQTPNAPPSATSITDFDTNGFMNACNGLQHQDGLDLILHTPGGEIAATQAIVTYLKGMFPDIRVIVPQLAMSAGTMIACAATKIIMGKQSSLGPIDPQLGGLPAHGILEEFQQAHREISQDPSKIPVWQPIIAKYPPTMIGECQKAIALAEMMVKQWLENGMFNGRTNPAGDAASVVDQLADHSTTLSHARHFSADECVAMGLDIEMLEADQILQDLVLIVHHAAMHALSATGTLKIIENHLGKGFVVGGGQ